MTNGRSGYKPITLAISRQLSAMQEEWIFKGELKITMDIMLTNHCQELVTIIRVLTKYIDTK